jgi:hypothetical protein
MRHHVMMRMRRIWWIEWRRVTRWVPAHVMRRRRWRIATVHGISTAVWWRWSTIRVMVRGMRRVRWKMGIPRVYIRSATVWISRSCSSCYPSAFVVFGLLTG